MDEIYWIWLQSVLGAANRAAVSVLERGLSPYEIFNMSRAEQKAQKIFTPLQIEKMQETPLRHSQEVYNYCMERGYHILTPRMVEYPELLRNIDSPPLALYVEGDVGVMQSQLSIGMVGARKMSVYGSRAAKDLARGLAMRGFTVVSGLAVGIDAQSHQGAMEGGGKTVAVIGCGLDIDYPAPNRQLRREIVKHGAVVSEYPPKTPPLGYHFPIRNRIISGLSLGVIVVEASRRSGSLVTAGHALTQGRDVFAVPTDIYDPNGEGALHLIKQGAKLVTCPEDVTEEYFWIYRDKMSTEQAKTAYLPWQSSQPEPEQLSFIEDIEESAAQEDKKKKKLRDIPEYLTPQQRDVLERLTTKPQPVEALLPQTDLTMYELLSIMTELEIYGLIKAYPGKQFSI